jgi:hypothetical protein
MHRGVGSTVDVISSVGRCDIHFFATFHVRFPESGDPGCNAILEPREIIRLFVSHIQHMFARFHEYRKVVMRGEFLKGINRRWFSNMANSNIGLMEISH